MLLQNCKAMLYWQDVKNFVEQIPSKFGGFYVIKINWCKLCCRQAHQISIKISVEICISADIQKANIGRSLFQIA